MPQLTTVTLADGSEIRMRPIEPGDKEALRSGFEQLSSESRYRRFFSPMSELSGTVLRYLTEIDHRDHEAIIGFDAGGEPVGVARYVRTSELDAAEVAVTVVDHWHGRGVATALLERLVVRARAEGISHFVAVVLSENEAALELFRHLADGGAEQRTGASGNTELLIELPREDRVPGSALGSALRSAAGDKVQINPWRLLKRRVIRPGEPGDDADID